MSTSAEHRWLSDIEAARRVGTPLIAVNTPDPAATVQRICGRLRGSDPAVLWNSATAPRIVWDFARGMTGLNDAGREFVKQVGEFDPTQSNPFALLTQAAAMPPGTLLFMHLANRWLAEPSAIQACWNLRDVFKVNHRTLVLLGPQITLPAELEGDVVSIDEPLPAADELRGIIVDQHTAAGVEFTTETVERAVEAVQGLPAFAVEQVTAMSLRRSGLDVDSLWERKRQQIEQTPGLKVSREAGSFESIGGVEVVKGFLRRIMQGQARPNAIVFVDEIEKMLGGAGGDLSGVSQDQLGALLSYMQDHGAAGAIFIGPPGAAKSAVAKAAGNEGGVPTIQLDLGGAKGSLVGESEHNLRRALKVVTSVSNGRSLWIATCNSITDLPPELRRRFTLGTFFFDLPDEVERAAIWDIYRSRNPELAEQDLPADAGWTGAEIRQCCDIAWRLGCTLQEAAGFVVPVSRSAADQIQSLRRQADGRFLSASRPGVYQHRPDEPVSDGRAGRTLALAD